MNQVWEKYKVLFDIKSSLVCKLTLPLFLLTAIVVLYGVYIQLSALNKKLYFRLPSTQGIWTL